MNLMQRQINDRLVREMGQNIERILQEYDPSPHTRRPRAVIDHIISRIQEQNAPLKARLALVEGNT